MCNCAEDLLDERTNLTDQQKFKLKKNYRNVHIYKLQITDFKLISVNIKSVISNGNVYIQYGKIYMVGHHC